MIFVKLFTICLVGLTLPSVQGKVVVGGNERQLEWWKTGIIYQIYTKSFRDTNGDGIGDLKGITEKVDYLAELGVNILWLNPIYLSGGKDNGYDVSSFTLIDPVYGTMNDFDELLEKLHSKGMYLIMDFIPNHTSNQHPWFIESNKNNCNEYRDYYVWVDNCNDTVPPNNWKSVFGGPAWTYSETRRAWYLHQFLVEQPDLNMRSEKVQNEIKGAISYWLDTKKVDGLRIDAFKFVFESEGLEDEPIIEKNLNKPNDYDHLDHIYTTSLPETYELVTEWRSFIDEISAKTKKEKFMVVEVYEQVSELMKYFRYNDKLGAHFPFNFQFISLYNTSSFTRMPTSAELIEFRPKNIRRLISEWTDVLPAADVAWSNWQMGNHDNPRIGSRVGYQNIDIANAINLLIGGTPTTYYGEEIGMVDLPVDQLAFEDAQDEAGIKFGPQLFSNFSRDYERTPMQWDTNESTFSGFTVNCSRRRPWLPIHPNYKTVNVQSELEESQSHLRIYMQLARLRQHPSFQYGSLDYLVIDEDIFSFIRKAPYYKTYLVLMNISDKNRKINLHEYGKQIPLRAQVSFYSHRDDDEKCRNNDENANNKKFVDSSSIIMRARDILVLEWF